MRSPYPSLRAVVMIASIVAEFVLYCIEELVRHGISSEIRPKSGSARLVTGDRTGTPLVS